MPDFIPGLELSRLFFIEAVQPVIDATFPDLRYDAALIDSGSEVLGFDTEMSRDHHWGPRVSIFVSADVWPEVAAKLTETLRQRLPYIFRGYFTSFEPIPDEPRTLRFEDRIEGPVNHRVSVLALREFAQGYLGVDLDGELTPADWLAFPQQKLRTLTHGAVYCSGLGEVDAMRRRLQFFPRDVWLYLLAAGWMRISQEEPFVGRTGDVGDELGSRVILARLIRDVMMLCFLMERVYAPYPKWFGTAFSKLRCAPALAPIFHRAFAADAWRGRERAMSEAYRLVAGMHNALGITDPLPADTSSFHQRPYQVIHGERFAEALVGRIVDDEVERIAARKLIGSVDLFSDSTDLRHYPHETLRALYD